MSECTPAPPRGEWGPLGVRLARVAGIAVTAVLVLLSIGVDAKAVAAAATVMTAQIAIDRLTS